MNDCNKCIVKGVKCSKINASCKAIREISEQSIRQFAEWLECSGFYYDEVEAFWCRTHYDGKIFAEEVYTTNELLNLYGKEQR